MSDLHGFLYSASSKGVHFSVTEHRRSAYFSPGSGATVTLAAPSYVAYRSGFVLYWLCYLLVRTLAAVGPTLPGSSDASSDDDDDGLLSIAKRVAAYGKVPIVMPFELNLEEGWPTNKAFSKAYGESAGLTGPG
jgi:hypothetical protein